MALTENGRGCRRFVTIVGARPQFIKAAPVSRAFAARGTTEIMVHTGQHYDTEMSDVFIEELGLSTPAYNLDIRSGSHGVQTGRMLEALEGVLLQIKPDAVIVYGDTNSTLAGSLAACKLGIPLAHVEAGLRSNNRSMPEEHNRVLSDHAADLLFCPTKTAVDNLRNEGITRNVHLVGDTMYDAVRLYPTEQRRDMVLGKFGLAAGKFVLATIHRPYNTDYPARLQAILEGLAALDETVVFPVHPRTRARIEAAPSLCRAARRVQMIAPVGYLDMLALQNDARVVVTDSGGVQKEAYFLGVPCLTVRPETEWVETLEGGWNRLIPADATLLSRAVAEVRIPESRRVAFGDGFAAERITELLHSFLSNQEHV